MEGVLPALSLKCRTGDNYDFTKAALLSASRSRGAGEQGR